jgi:plastocyanin domain-containing protein
MESTNEKKSLLGSAKNALGMSKEAIEKRKKTIMIGSIVGAVCVIIIVVVLLWVFYWKKDKTTTTASAPNGFASKSVQPAGTRNDSSFQYEPATDEVYQTSLREDVSPEFIYENNSSPFVDVPYDQNEIPSSPIRESDNQLF